MGVHQLLQRGIYHNEAPAQQTRNERNPTLLVSWWCTIFALTIILIRILGRWIRTEKLFREDKIMALSIIPLLIRMGLVHVILIYGTNNVDPTGLSRESVLHRETGSKLVLAARIFYAAFIWIAKLAVLEFLKRTIKASWVKSYEIGLRLIYIFLTATFVAVIIGTLAECHPFTHYWQVMPDPGPQCREGLVQLIVMGVCDIVSDLVLILFPIPLVLSSQIPVKKKLSLIGLFLLSILMIIVTAYRVPSTISRKSAQPYRSLLASVEILAAAFIANAVVIGSFIRDKGVKKAKFRQASIVTEGGGTLSRVPTRSQTIALNHWGSDEDLVRDMVVALPTNLRRGITNEEVPKVAQPVSAAPVPTIMVDHELTKPADPNWKFNQASPAKTSRRSSASSATSASTDAKLRDLKSQLQQDTVATSTKAEISTPNKVSFFDVGGLADDAASSVSPDPPKETVGKRENNSVSTKPKTGSRAFLSDIGGLLGGGYPDDSERGSTDRGSRRDRSPMTKSQSKSPERRIRKFSLSPRPSRVSGDIVRPKPLSIKETEDNIKDENTVEDQAQDGFGSLNISDAGGLLK